MKKLLKIKNTYSWPFWVSKLVYLKDTASDSLGMIKLTLSWNFKKIVKYSLMKYWHWKYTKYFLPNTIQNRSIRKYTNIHIRHNDIVKVTLLLVWEKQVGHPYSACIRKRQVFNSTWNEKKNYKISGRYVKMKLEFWNILTSKIDSS